MSWIDDKMELEIKAKKEIQKKREIELRQGALNMKRLILEEKNILPYFEDICDIAASANSELVRVNSPLRVSSCGSQIIIRLASGQDALKLILLRHINNYDQINNLIRYNAI